MPVSRFGIQTIKIAKTGFVSSGANPPHSTRNTGLYYPMRQPEMRANSRYLANTTMTSSKLPLVHAEPRGDCEYRGSTRLNRVATMTPVMDCVSIWTKIDACDEATWGWSRQGRKEGRKVLTSLVRHHDNTFRQDNIHVLPSLRCSQRATIPANR